MIDFRKEPPRSPRRPHVPFPSLHPAERIRGSGILDEHQGIVGQLLWESYRNVGDWAILSRKKRHAALFGAAAVERRNRQLSAEWMEPELRAPLEVIRDLMAEPRKTETRVVARACRQLSAWAGERGALATQFYFAAAAGLCLTEDARQAYHTGCLAREIARWDAAEVWLEHAMETARRRRERETQVMAVLGMGNMYYRQGFYQRARDVQNAALLQSRKYGLREVEGRALHDLFVNAVELNELRQAEQYAREALHAYGQGHPLIPALAHDVAYFWMNQHCFSPALKVLEALLPRFRHSEDQRIRVLANIGRAAGGCGDQRTFEEVWAGVWDAVDQQRSGSTAAHALVDLACGALNLRAWDYAISAASRALEFARQRGEVDVIARAEVIVDAAGANRHVLDVRELVHPQAETEKLAVELVDSLNEDAAA